MKMPAKSTIDKEKAEAKGLKSGKLSVPKYLAGEKKEGKSPSLATAKALKSGKMSPDTYAKREK